MRQIYIATEFMGVIIILILLYANIFELKIHTKKKSIFAHLLIFNGIVVAADAVTWMDLDWQNMTALFWCLLTITYIVPFLLVGTFSAYIYEHINQKSQVSDRPFKLITYSSVVVGVVCLIFCVSGQMFQMKNGKYYPTSLESAYYVFYIIILLFLAAVIIVNGSKLGTHDLIATISFCLVPLFSIVISISGWGINLAVPSMSMTMLLIYIMLQAERESKLIDQSNTDELTGLLNRRAYEDDMMHYPDVPPEADFVYASIDINGLKQINDTLGHVAGDELICGVAFCLKKSLGNYGRVYRVGGDEFVSMFFADELHLKSVLEELNELTQQWHGKLVNSLAISIGCVSKREFSSETVEEMAKIADKRMYADKKAYYENKGVDRRGQNEAHKVLCSLYTKILRINITNDSFAVVNMDMIEQTKERGYSERISEWLQNFGGSGGVHPDDLEDYLAKTNMDYMRSYFKRKKTSLTVMYRRKYEDGFKQVMMEILPATDYSDEYQSLFLYVKNIDI